MYTALPHFPQPPVFYFPILFFFLIDLLPQLISAISLHQVFPTNTSQQPLILTLSSIFLFHIPPSTHWPGSKRVWWMGWGRGDRPGAQRGWAASQLVCLLAVWSWVFFVLLWASISSSVGKMGMLISQEECTRKSFANHKVQGNGQLLIILEHGPSW